MRRVAFFLSGWLIVPGLACGSSESSPSSTGGAMSGGSGGAGSGGTGSSAGGTGGGAGTLNAGGTASGGTGAGGTSVWGDSQAEACIAYGLAACKRRSECAGGTGEDCLNATWFCPDATWSPGSTRTIEGLKACAETYATLPCDQVQADVLPACVTPGERAQGEACVFASQCSTLSCKIEPGVSCGKCAVQVGVGESCAADDVTCADGAFCEEGECVALTGSTDPDPLPGANEPCSPGLGCVTDYYCPTGTENPVCTAMPTAGQPCAPATICASDSYCVENELSERVCTARPGLGEPCASALDSPIEQPYICPDDLLCSYTSPTDGTCEPWPEAGEPCNIPPSNPTYGRCAGGLHCNFAADPPVCGGLGAPGEPCEIDSDCTDDLWCACPDNAPECEVKVCLSFRFAGEPCGEAGSSCHPAFDCVAGACVPAELRGVFADACGG